MQEKKRNGFLSGVSVLTLSALTVKVIGLCYRIPLLSRLGTEGMGYFNTAYELYALFCVISTAGLPVAMSVLISSAESEGRPGRGRSVYRTALWLFIIMGAVGSLMLYGFATPLSHLLKNEGSADAIRLVSPTVFFICLSSAYRGYFQGRRNMVPTAVSQVVEALGKLLLGLLFATAARKNGADLPMTAAFAVLGLTVGTAVSVLYLYLHKRWWDARHPLPAVTEAAKEGGVLRRLLATAVPITISAGIMSLTKCIDLALILRRLQEAGATAAEANSLYGCYSTLVVPVFNILPSLTTSVALSAVPALSAALGKGEAGRAEVRKVSLSALRMTLLIAIPAAMGLSVFAEDVLDLLFGSRPEAVAMAAPWLTCLSLSVPAACLITVTAAMLQACGHAECPVIAMILGATAKTALAYVLLGKASVGILGAPISSLVCDGIIVAVHFGCIARYGRDMLPTVGEGIRLFAIPLVLSAVAVGAVLAMRRLCGWGDVTPVHTMGTVVSVACIYGGCVMPLLIKRKTIQIT